jgi:hypothetical protein
MMFTIGILMAVFGFAIGHLFGDKRLRTWNKFDYVASTMFVVGVLLMSSSVLTITWRYMP